MASRGARAELWSASVVAEHFPDWNLAQVEAALHEPEGGWVDGPDLAAQNAMDAARARGANLISDRVVGVVVHRGRRATGLVWRARAASTAARSSTRRGPGLPR